MTKDHSNDQLLNYKKSVAKPFTMTTSNGAPIHNKNAVLTAGPRGPMLMQDVVYMDEMAHFDRERIPERVVHAKGAGTVFFLVFWGPILIFQRGERRVFADFCRLFDC